MVIEQFINFDRNLFAVEDSILTWHFMPPSLSTTYWFAGIPNITLY